MFDHEIKDMVQCLVDAGLIDESKVTEAAGSLGWHWRNKMALVWSVNDVIARIPDITQEDAVKVLKEAHRIHGGCRHDFDDLGFELIYEDMLKEREEVDKV